MWENFIPSYTKLRASEVAMKPIHTDAKGRVNLGREFAGQLFQVTALIPERELWIHKNKAAKAKVEQGISEAKAGKLTKNAINLGLIRMHDIIQSGL